MALFPTLKTGAIAQYPTTLRLSFGPTRSVEFLDGSSHRYCTGPRQLRQWVVRLDRLDNAEAASLFAFAVANREQTFSFVDPFSGETVVNCGFADSRVSTELAGEDDHDVTLVVEERA